MKSQLFSSSTSTATTAAASSSTPTIRFTVFFAFMLPLFFIASGMVYTAGKRTIKENIRIKFKQLMLSILAVSFNLFNFGNHYSIWYIRKVILYQEYLKVFLFRQFMAVPLRSVFADMKITSTGRYSASTRSTYVFWFLPALFVGFVIFVLVTELTEKHKNKTLLRFISLIFLTILTAVDAKFDPPLPFSISSGIFAAVLLLAGYQIKEKEFWNIKNRLKGSYWQ